MMMKKPYELTWFLRLQHIFFTEASFNKEKMYVSELFKMFDVLETVFLLCLVLFLAF